MRSTSLAATRSMVWRKMTSLACPMVEMRSTRAGFGPFSSSGTATWASVQWYMVTVSRIPSRRMRAVSSSQVWVTRKGSSCSEGGLR